MLAGFSAAGLRYCVTQGQAAKSLVIFDPIGFEINVDGKAQTVWSRRLSNSWRTGERERERERERGGKRVSNVLKLISRKKKKKKRRKND